MTNLASDATVHQLMKQDTCFKLKISIDCVYTLALLHLVNNIVPVGHQLYETRGIPSISGLSINTLLKYQKLFLWF